MAVAQKPGGSSAAGVVHYTLNKTAIGEILATYSGLNAGSVAANDRVRHAWNFTLADVGAAPIGGVQWTLTGYYDSRSGPFQSYTLASGNEWGTFAGTQEYVYPTAMPDMTWHGMTLLVTATVAGDHPGEYQMDANVNDLSYVYEAVPEPSLGLFSTTAGAIVLMLRRRRPDDPS